MFVLPEYQGEKISDVTLVIAPFIGEVTFQSDETTDDPSEQKYQKESIDFFQYQLALAIKNVSGFNNVLPDTYSAELKFDEKMVPETGKKTFPLKLPVSETRIGFESSLPDFILFIEDLRLAIFLETSTPMVGKGEITKKTLTCAAKYVIWDNTSNRPVQYGWDESRESNIMSFVTPSMWHNVIKDFARKLIRGGPFQK